MVGWQKMSLGEGSMEGLGTTMRGGTAMMILGTSDVLLNVKALEVLSKLNSLVMKAFSRDMENPR